MWPRGNIMVEIRTNGRRALGLLVAGLLLATSSFGAAAEETGSDDWEFLGEIYLWGPRINATTTAGDKFSIRLDDILENLDMTIMAQAGVRKGDWTVFADGLYMDLEGGDSSSTKILRRSIRTSLDIELFAVAVTGGVGYAVVNDDSNRVDLIAGARYLWLDVDLDFDIGALKEKASESGSVIDGIVGFRTRTKLADRWDFLFYADIGTGDSDITWQALGAVTYKYKSVDLIMGYRWLTWNFGGGAALDDLTVYGPFAGVKFGF